MTVDLDAARRARREIKKHGPEVVFGGETYELAPELPYDVLEPLSAFGGGDLAGLTGLVRALLGEHYDAFVATKPSIDDMHDLVGGLIEEYGLGNSSASGTS